MNEEIKKDLHKHYIMMKRVQLAGGLRKELTPETCVAMLLEYKYNFNTLNACIIACEIKNQLEPITKDKLK